MAEASWRRPGDDDVGPAARRRARHGRASAATPASERWPRSISISGHSLSPSDRRAAAGRSRAAPRCEDAALRALAPRDSLELAQLLERIDPDVRVGADAIGMPRSSNARPGRSRRRGRPRSSGTRTPCARAWASRSSSAPSACVAWTTVVRSAETAAACEQLDRPHAVLGEALLDLARLLVGVDVERQALPRGVRPISSSQSRGQARTECGATPTRIPPRAAPRPRARYASTDGCRKRSIPPRA